MIGLDGWRPDMTEYRDCINLIESHVKQFTAEELEIKNAELRQAGVTCIQWQDFQKTKHVSAIFGPIVSLVKYGKPLTLGSAQNS